MKKASAAKVPPLTRQEPERREQPEADRRLLETINARLARLNLTPLSHLGVAEDGWKVLRYGGVACENPQYVIVRFVVRKPDGTQGDYFMKFAAEGAKSRGCVIIPVINRSMAVVRQHRAPLITHPTPETAWTSEFPRASAVGACHSSLVDRKLLEAYAAQGENDSPSWVFNTAGRELVALIKEDGTRVQCFKRIGTFPEDSGMSTVFPEVWALRLEVPNFETLLKESRGPRYMRIMIHPLRDLFSEEACQRMNFQDAHSLAALQLFTRAWIHAALERKTVLDEEALFQSLLPPR